MGRYHRARLRQIKCFNQSEPQNLRFDRVRVAAEDHLPFSDHLRRYPWLLRDKPDLRATLKQMIQRQRCIDEPAFFRLLRAGLVKGSGQVCRCRCSLYRTYFEDNL